MRFESVKSFVLTILVLLSILLTWGLWTYQPDYDTIENTTNIVRDVSISNTKEVSSLIRPTKVLFHFENQHFGTVDETNITTMVRDIRKWEIYDFTNISSTISSYDFLRFTQKPGHVQVLYPDEIPLTLFRPIYKLTDQNLPSVSFDRMIINMNVDDEKSGIVYFVSNANQLIYEAKVGSEYIDDFNRHYYQSSNSYPEYFSYSVTETKSIFLPKNKTPMHSVQYYTDFLDPEIFKEALFADPNIVKKHILTYGEEYTDGSKLLQVNAGRKYIQFVNPVNNTENTSVGSSDLIKSSIDFINDHGGWTDTYHFFSWNKFEQRTVFRLYVKNYPVFNKNGLTEIHQVWNKNEIMRYQRPLLVLEIPIPSAEIELPSGEVILKAISSQPDFQPHLLEDITLGYELIETPEKISVATLVPIWSYKYEGRWKRIDVPEELGGNEGGLE